MENPSGKWFQPFDGTDWTLLGVTALADFADLDSSYSLVTHERSIAGTSMPCTSPSETPPCVHGLGSGEENPLITGLFGIKYPTALDYTAFGALELATQAAIAWALPEKWRTGAFGVFIGIGVADTVGNSYGGGVTFRF
jgi:hypothetical protein